MTPQSTDCTREEPRNGQQGPDLLHETRDGEAPGVQPSDRLGCAQRLWLQLSQRSCRLRDPNFGIVFARAPSLRCEGGFPFASVDGMSTLVIVFCKCIPQSAI